MNTKILTPMKRYRDSLTTLRKCLAPSFEIKEFSRSETIREDFVIVFYPKADYRDEEFRSFAITFDYTDKPADQHRAVFSIKPVNKSSTAPAMWDGEWQRYEKREARRKLNESIFYSDNMLVEDFNTLLKEWLSALKMLTATGEAITPDVIIDMADRHFFDNKQTLSEQVDALTKQLTAKLTPSKQALETAHARLRDTADDVKTTKRGIERSLVRSKEYRRVRELEQLLAEAKTDLQNRQAQIEETQLLSDKKRDNREADKHYQQNKKALLTSVENAVAEQPAVLRGSLKTALRESLGLSSKGRL